MEEAKEILTTLENKMEILKKRLKNFPALLKDLETNTVRSYSTAGVRDINDADKKAIKKLEKLTKSTGIKVICIVKSTQNWLGVRVTMIDYVLSENAYEDEFDTESVEEVLEIYSECHNKTFKISEIGIIGIIENNGIVERIY